MEKDLFSKFKNMTKIAEPVDVNAVSRISEGTSVSGEVSSSNDVRVDGRVEGKMFSEGRIVVGEKAFIKGTILCTDLDLWGTVEGEVYVKGLLTVKNTASVSGDIHVRRLQVEMGAAINGTCKMITEDDFEQGAAAQASDSAEVE